MGYATTSSIWPTANRLKQRREKQPELQLSSNRAHSSYSPRGNAISKSNLPNYFNYFLVKKHKTHLCVLIFSFPLFPSIPDRYARCSQRFAKMLSSFGCGGQGLRDTRSLWLLLIKSLVNLLRNLANPTPARTVILGVGVGVSGSLGIDRLLNAISDGRVRVLPVWSRQMESRLHGSLWWPTTTKTTDRRVVVFNCISLLGLDRVFALFFFSLDESSLSTVIVLPERYWFSSVDGDY